MEKIDPTKMRRQKKKKIVMKRKETLWYDEFMILFLKYVVSSNF